jgi:hypothetical protein
MKHLLSSLLLVCIGVACSTPFEPAVNNGVNDVVKACELRKAWTKRESVACTDCLAISSAPACDCPAYQQDFAAVCYEQSRARASEPQCEGVPGCVAACDRADCACIDACFAGKDRCRELTSAADGCTTDVCDAYCR